MFIKFWQITISFARLVTFWRRLFTHIWTRKTCGCYINIFGYYILDAIFSQLTYVAWLCGTFARTKNSSNLTIFDIVIGLPYLSEWGPIPPKGLHGVPALLLRLSQLSSHIFLVYNDGNKYIWHRMLKMKWCLIFYWGWYSLTIRVECRGGSKEGDIWRTPLPSRNQILLNFIEFFSEKQF